MTVGRALAIPLPRGILVAMSVENVEVVRRAFEAFDRGDRATFEVNMRVASVYEIRDGMVASVRDYNSRNEALEAARLSE